MESKNIRIATSGIYDYAYEELDSLGLTLPCGAQKKKIYKVYRPAIVMEKSKDKFKMLPLTHHHPAVPVDDVNFRDLVIGYTGDTVWVDHLDNRDEVGIRAMCVLYDSEALDAYERGEIQLSAGYHAVFDWAKGTAPDGQDYDIIMKDIISVNHVALLPLGRGGSDASIMDGAPEGNDNASKDHVKEDKNGFSFIKNKNGSENFGEIIIEQAKSIGMKSAPIKLSEGSETTYGLKHIEHQHGEQIRNAGYKNVLDFIEDIVSNFDEIHSGTVKNRNGEQVKSFYLAKSTSNGVIGIELELNKNGDFYTINNGGIFRRKYLQNKKTLWSAPHAQTQQQDSALDYGAKSKNKALFDLARGECPKGRIDSLTDVFISDKQKNIFEIYQRDIFEIAKAL